MPIGKFREKWRVRRGIAQLSSPGGIGRLSYSQRLKNLFGSSIVGYWRGNEEAGTVAVDYSGNGYNGVYTGVTLGQEGIGDGLTCPLYDGANDFTNIYSAGFAGAFNVNAGTHAIWLRMFNAAAWTDGTARAFFDIRADDTNRGTLLRSTVNNRLDFEYQAGGTLSQVVLSGMSSLDWMHIAFTWDTVADQFKAYFNGIQTGATQTGLGVWVGALSSTRCTIGSYTTTPLAVTNGWLAHALDLNRVATPAEMAQAAVI